MTSSSNAVSSSSSAAGLPGASAFPWQEPENLGPKRWLVLGPFPNAFGSGEAALDHDYLASIGGEAEPRIDLATSFEFGGKRQVVRELTPDPVRGGDLKALYRDDTDFQVAYAYGEITRERAEVAYALFGSDDGAAVWVNGRRVHRLVTAGRPLDPNSDRFLVELRAGINRFVVKIENATGEWGFALKIVDAEGQQRILALQSRRNLSGLELGPALGDFRLSTALPELVWGQANLAQVVLVDSAPRVRWFDPELREVERPEQVGRYVAAIEADTRDGFVHRALLTFVKSSRELLTELLPGVEAALPVTPRERVRSLLALPPLLEQASAKRSAAFRTELAGHVQQALAEYLRRGENAALALSALEELRDRKGPSGEPAWLSSAQIANAEAQLRLRMQLEGRAPRPLAPPQLESAPGPELRAGNEEQAGILPGTVQRLRALSQDWLKQDPNGFEVLVARRGVVFMHEGFGGLESDEGFYPASIGKLIAGLMFARAVDQGLVGFDDPVASVLPDWKHARTAGITFRHCFNHVTGLSGHASHSGLFNAYLDNALLVEDGAFMQPLARHQYNGDSYNLAGKALELLTGQSIWRLLYDHLQQPFGEPVAQFDLGSGDRFTARYVAKVGQMLLQDGRYGAYRFYQPGFVAKLRPERIVEHAPSFPDRELEWGIGQTWMPDPSNAPRAHGVLGPNVFGHGASSGSVFRVAPDHELVVVIGRNAHKQWDQNERFAATFMKALAEGLVRA